MPVGQRKPDAPDPAHCRLLADVARPAGHPQGATSLATAEFATLRLRLLKVAARVIDGAVQMFMARYGTTPAAYRVG